MIKVSWNELKSFIDSRNVSCQMVETESAYFLQGIDGSFVLETTLDKDDLKSSDQIEFETNYKPNANKVVISQVETRLEKDDKTLGLVSVEGAFVNDACTLEIEIPGSFGGVGRYVKEGYAFSDSYVWGMRVTVVALVDKSYLYAGVLYPAEPAPGVTWAEAMPDGVVLGNYADPEVAEENRGWRFWEEEGGQGGVDIDSLAGYGNLVAGCFLKIMFTKPTGSAPTKACANIQWGVPNV